MESFGLYTLIDGNKNSLPEQIANHILKKIFTGDLSQGTRLIESEIARELNVSNIPVREAFYILQSTGVIERLPRKGVRVKSISSKEIGDYMNALIELFRLGVNYSALKWDEEKYNQLRQYLKEASLKLEENDVLEYILKADQVCRYIFIVAGNQAFLRFYSEVTYITNAYCQTRWNDFEKKMKNYHSYIEGMVNAIIHSDFEKAKSQFELQAKLAIFD
ncbi:hypothetical protein A8F94_01245 [Bacillus sp. FJAT-27225]|uniref:GntR family transcriptional regulator n=1 Tax=Bacillus sp. FJAT-27225 TaxID=1743144 RepID=UPI00080C21DF|nr:GntR family transcriptional regulator [Bacillus sp. FJAT-27225]OCA90539.1 hypothetical protein A8F94_01245 [Bacillus sp. FJAT-27225]